MKLNTVQMDRVSTKTRPSVGVGSFDRHAQERWGKELPLGCTQLAIISPKDHLLVVRQLPINLEKVGMVYGEKISGMVGNPHNCPKYI